MFGFAQKTQPMGIELVTRHLLLSAFYKRIVILIYYIPDDEIRLFFTSIRINLIFEIIYKKFEIIRANLRQS